MAFRMRPLALAVSLAIPVAAAQQAATLPEVKVTAGPETPSYNAPTATTATKVDAPLRDIPQTVNVVPQAMLRDQAARSMQDALRFIPGIGLSHGDGQRDQVTIRGFSAIADQFIDGLRDDALYFRDLANIEQVEVIKGPASVLYGRGSSGGLINRMTRKPGADVAELMVQSGSWDQRRAEVDLGRGFRDGAFAYRVTGAIERADSYRSQQFLDRESAAPSVAWRSGDTTVTLQADSLNDRRLTDFGVPAFQGRPVDVDPSTYYGAANARDVDVSKSEVRGTTLTLAHRFNDRWSVRNAFRYYDYELVRTNTLVGSVNEAARTASLNHGNVRRQEDGWFNQTEVVHKLELGATSHQLLYGVEVGEQKKDQVFRTQNNVATVDLFNPVLPVLALAANAPASSDNLGILSVSSAYVQDLASFGQHWKALAGVRFDRFGQRTEERRAGQSNLSRTDSEWSPRAGIVYQPSVAQAYYVSYSKSFQPSAEAFPLAANNAQIAPEETTSHEAGAKLDFFDGLASAGLSVFRLERTNIKATDPATNRLVPLGVQRTDGIEVTFTGQLPAGWQVWSGFAWLDASMTSSPAVDAGQRVQGKRPTLTPKRSAMLWAVKDIAPKLRAGAGLSYVDDRYANPGNTVILPSYTTVDAMAQYRWGKVELQANLNNVTNRRYIVSGHGTSPNLNLPGAPRNVQLTARYAF